MTLRPPAADRLPGLDRLRGLAILMVIVGHYLTERHLAGPFPLGDFIGTLGRGGVLLFFLLSGYLIYRNVTRQDTGRFLLRRLSKIMPAYWISIVVIFVMGVLFAPGYPAYSAKTYLMNMLMIPAETGVETLSGVYWTLFIEVKFYLLAALFHHFARQRGWDLLLVGLLLANSGLIVWRGAGSSFLFFVPCFFIGVALRRAEEQNWSRRALLHLSSTALLVSLPFLLADPTYAISSPLYLLTLTALFALVLRFGRCPDGGLQFLGKISYSHYLYHTTLGYWLLQVMAPHWPVSELLLCLLVALLMTGVAWGSYHLVETPCVAAGRWLEQRLWPARTTPAPAPAAPR